MAFASFHNTGIQSVEKEPMSTANMNSFGHFSSDSETAIASQILASFRNTIFQKDRKDNFIDLRDKPIYHTFNEQHAEVPFTPQGISHKAPGVSPHLQNVSQVERNFEGVPYSRSLSTQEILDHPFVISEQITANHMEAYASHDIHQRQDSCLQFGSDCTSLVTSTQTTLTDAEIDGDSSNHYVSNAHQKDGKAQQKLGHELPPCRVCGCKASGFHYGANTCEACKVSVTHCYPFKCLSLV